MKKKFLSIILTAILTATSTVMFTGCGNENAATPDTAIATFDAATVDEVSTIESVADETVPMDMDETDNAIIEAGLQVDSNGNVTDKDGNKIEADKDGNVKLKTDDGKTISVNSSKIENVNKAAAQNLDSSDKASNSSNKTSGSSSSKSSSNALSSISSTNKNNSSSNSGASNSEASNTNSKTSSNSASSSSSKTNSSSSSSKTTSATWHEAVYKTVNHPAETEQVKVVDKEAYTYDEPVYEYQYRTICLTCGADITGNTTAHNKQHALNGENVNWGTRKIEVQTGTKTVTVPEEYHYETVVIKEAWTEKVLIKEAGYY